jgi:hypothetical protein
MRTQACWLAVALFLGAAGCGDDDGPAQPDGGNEVVDAGNDAGGDRCLGAAGACLTNQGSTQFEDIRVEENGIANVMTDILLAQGTVQAGEPIDVAFINAGAIRAGSNSGPPDFTWSSETARIGDTFGPGPITAEDIRGWFPFQDDNVVMTLTGEQIKRSLESAVRTWADDAGLTFGPDLAADKAGELLHVAGLKYQVQCAGTERMRLGPADCNPFAGECVYQNPDTANSVSRIEIGGEVIYDAAAGGWQGVGPDRGDKREFRVIMNSYAAAGLDGHTDFAEGTNRATVERATWDYVAELVTQLEANAPTTLDDAQGRIEVAGEVGGLACNLPATCLPAHAAHENCSHL